MLGWSEEAIMFLIKYQLPPIIFGPLQKIMRVQISFLRLDLFEKFMSG
jgi:hypothetical protein